MTYSVSLSLNYSVWSIISAHNLTPLKRDDWQRVTFVYRMHGQAEYAVDHVHKISIIYTAYYALLHSHNTL